MTFNYKLLLVLMLCAVLTQNIFAQAEHLFNGVSLGEHLDTTTQKIGPICETMFLHNNEDPTFPLAKDSEKHLVCSNIKTSNGIIDKMVFTFADDKLCYIEAHGNSIRTLSSKRKDTARTYIDYDVYVKDRLFLHKNKDIAWILNQEAMHTNLFTWENPYLLTDKVVELKNNSDNSIPEFIEMGADIEQLKSIFTQNSTFTHTEELDGSDPNAQVQINCFGVDYLGFPRKIEARFGDGKLNVVWILTGKGEEDRIRKALIDQYGEPIYTNEEWEIYNNWQVGLRKDKPEILLMEKSIGLEYKTSYFKQ